MARSHLYGILGLRGPQPRPAPSPPALCASQTVRARGAARPTAPTERPDRAVSAMAVRPLQSSRPPPTQVTARKRAETAGKGQKDTHPTNPGKGCRQRSRDAGRDLPTGRRGDQKSRASAGPRGGEAPPGWSSPDPGLPFCPASSQPPGLEVSVRRPSPCVLALSARSRQSPAASSSAASSSARLPGAAGAAVQTADMAQRAGPVPGCAGFSVWDPGGASSVGPCAAARGLESLS